MSNIIKLKPKKSSYDSKAGVFAGWVSGTSTGPSLMFNSASGRTGPDSKMFAIWPDGSFGEVSEKEVTNLKLVRLIGIEVEEI